MAAITSGIFAGAMLSQVAMAGAAVAGAGAAIANTAISASKSAKEMKSAPKFDAAKANRKAALQEAEANRRRVLSESDTIKTSALGNTTGTNLQKKTLLGG